MVVQDIPAEPAKKTEAHYRHHMYMYSLNVNMNAIVHVQFVYTCYTAHHTPE